MESNYLYLYRCNAKVAQLVELQPSKLVVASSSLVFRSLSRNFCFGFFIFYIQMDEPHSNIGPFGKQKEKIEIMVFSQSYVNRETSIYII